MSGASPLKLFNNTLVEFFEDLAETYPDERDIALATEGLKALRTSNPRMILTLFMTNVYPIFKEPVVNRDEEALTKLAHEVLTSQYSEIAYAFWIFDKHWKGMSEANKEHIWKYCSAIIILAERASAA